MNEQDQNLDSTVVPETDTEVETTVSNSVDTDEVATPVVEDNAQLPAETIIETEVVEDIPKETSDTADVVPVIPLPTVAEKIKATLLKQKYTVAAVIVVVIIMLLLTFVMERQGRIQTGLFDGVNKLLATKTAVAKVNDRKVTQYDLDISISQLSAAAAAQGADPESEELKAEIQKQAVDMLVNTELLKQEAGSRNIEITEEDVNARLDTLKTDIGGEEELAKRMEEFSIDEKTLRRDIKNELTIQTLLDEVFKEKNIGVTEEEVSDFYEKAGGKKAGLPDIETVRPQIEAQIRSGKEQEVVTAFIEELRAKSTIEVLI